MSNISKSLLTVSALIVFKHSSRQLTSVVADEDDQSSSSRINTDHAILQHRYTTLVNIFSEQLKAHENDVRPHYESIQAHKRDLANKTRLVLVGLDLDQLGTDEKLKHLTEMGVKEEDAKLALNNPSYIASATEY